ncbi:MAG: hypothetical protein QOK36_2325 [Gaiellales bacterium]|nr:hypothetical protein [Gaiellales bacterium]
MPRPCGDQPTHLDERLDAVLIGGREPGVVTVADYDPLWPARYEAVRTRIAAALGECARGLEHIGSTAVPGLAAKPIIDVLVEVDDPEDEAGFRPAMEEAGFELRVRERGHRMFRTRARDVHVHLWPAGSVESRDYLLLRDRLRACAEDRRRYERVKRELAERSWPDLNDYAEAKGPLIAEILARARVV